LDYLMLAGQWCKMEAEGDSLEVIKSQQ